jgi:hypothetical protein
VCGAEHRADEMDKAMGNTDADEVSAEDSGVLTPKALLNNQLDTA